MGRLKKYNTEEERKEANRQKSKRYYWRNKKKIDKKVLEKYYDNLQNNKFNK